MNDTRARLVKCFAAIFPDLSEGQIDSASSTNMNEWDSVATVTLITLIEEEFGIEVEADDLERLVSFDSVLDYLEQGKKE
jgi:acyl carrier protein